jgi:hypothetical protein
LKIGYFHQISRDVFWFTVLFPVKEYASYKIGFSSANGYLPGFAKRENPSCDGVLIRLFCENINKMKRIRNPKNKIECVFIYI